MDEVGPLQFREPCAPHIAAKLEGREIDRAALLAAIRRSASKGDFALIEGVGGFRVPLTDDWDTADLAERPGDAGGAGGGPAHWAASTTRC